MSAIRHRLVRASAGTGKTHALTTRYLELLFQGARPERMLATTFTRKAAREIFERVLARLVDAAEDGGKRLKLSREIGRELSRDECVVCVGTLTRHLDRVRIATLDAYFAERAREAELDLGLAPGWRIADELEDEELVLDAVEQALVRASNLEWVELLQDLQRAPAELAVHTALVRVFAESRRVLLESDEDAWTRVAPGPAVAPEALERALAALEALALPKTKAGSVERNWQKNVDECLRAAREGDWEALFEVGLVKKIAAGEDFFSRHAIEAEHVEALEPLLDRAVHAAIADLAVQNRAARDLARRLEKAYAELQRARGAYRFDDLPREIADARAPAERATERIDHLLLDEFQDTSPLQWQALRDRVDAIVGTDDASRTFFCVGDAKQSIYGWRDAEPRLMASLAERYPSVEVETLSKSYRSSPVVIDTVNRVFARIAENPALAKKNVEAELAAARDFQAAFDVHATERDFEGVATLWEASPPDDEGSSATLACAVERVVEVLDRAPGRSVGVLVRGGKSIPEILHRLKCRGVAASGEGGNPLTDSSVVLAALSLLHLADHPGDTAAAFHVASSPLACVVSLGLAAGDEARTALARAVRGSIARRGLGTWTSELANAVHGAIGDFDRARLEKLVDLAFAFESRAPFRTSAFVEHVRREAVEDVRAAGVKVMTVHKSKGLEFDVVVLPELDASMRRRSHAMWTERPDPAGPIEIATHPAPKIVAERHALLEHLATEACKGLLMEELCVLYVAMTRAKHELHMIVPPVKAESEALTAAAILRGALAPEATAVDGVLWRHPASTATRSDDAAASARAPVAARSDIERSTPRIRFRDVQRPGTASRSPSRELVRPRANVFRTLRSRPSSRAHGILVHRFLAEVEWLESFDASDERLLAIARVLEPDPRAVQAALATFRVALERHDVRAVLAREAQADREIEVWRERRFAVVLDGGARAQASVELWTGTFDRVHVVHEHGRAASAVVFDFKTAGDAAHYAPQMDAYARVLAKMTGMDPRAIETRVVLVGPRD